MNCICGNKIDDSISYCAKCGLGKHSDYQPSPLNIKGIELSQSYNDLIEKIAENIHEEWADLRMKDGWTYGEMRDDRRFKQILKNQLSNFSDKIAIELGDFEWKYGSLEREQRKKHNCLVPFELLEEDKKNFNRILAENMLKVIISLGYDIVKIEKEENRR